jgi:hypothetical protein
VGNRKPLRFEQEDCGDNTTAGERYQEFLSIWKDADPDRSEVAAAKEFLVKQLIAKK